MLESIVDIKSELVIDKVEPRLTETRYGNERGYIQQKLPLQEADQRVCNNSDCNYKTIANGRAKGYISR